MNKQSRGRSSMRQDSTNNQENVDPKTLTINGNNANEYASDSDDAFQNPPPRDGGRPQKRPRADQNAHAALAPPPQGVIAAPQNLPIRYSNIPVAAPTPVHASTNVNVSTTRLRPTKLNAAPAPPHQGVIAAPMVYVPQKLPIRFPNIPVATPAPVLGSVPIPPLSTNVIIGTRRPRPTKKMTADQIFEANGGMQALVQSPLALAPGGKFSPKPLSPSHAKAYERVVEVWDKYVSHQHSIGITLESPFTKGAALPTDDILDEFFRFKINSAQGKWKEVGKAGSETLISMVSMRNFIQMFIKKCEDESGVRVERGERERIAGTVKHYQIHNLLSDNKLKKNTAGSIDIHLVVEEVLRGSYNNYVPGEDVRFIWGRVKDENEVWQHAIYCEVTIRNMKGKRNLADRLPVFRKFEKDVSTGQMVKGNVMMTAGAYGEWLKSVYVYLGYRGKASLYTLRRYSMMLAERSNAKDKEITRGAGHNPKSKMRDSHYAPGIVQIDMGGLRRDGKETLNAVFEARIEVEQQGQQVVEVAQSSEDKDDEDYEEIDGLSCEELTIRELENLEATRDVTNQSLSRPNIPHILDGIFTEKLSFLEGVDHFVAYGNQVKVLPWIPEFQPVVGTDGSLICPVDNCTHKHKEGMTVFESTLNTPESLEVNFPSGICGFDGCQWSSTSKNLRQLEYHFTQHAKTLTCRFGNCRNVTFPTVDTAREHYLTHQKLSYRKDFGYFCPICLSFMNSTAFALDAMRHYNEGFQFPISPRTSFKPVQAPIPFVYCLLCVHNTDLTWHARLKPHIAHRLIQHINHSHFLTHQKGSIIPVSTLSVASLRRERPS
ncbi:hypothetical protein BC829DRAFT_432287 [Chytridium lagenaria]|nr:hypothetical protein BC829DRAFT_432287 [Chytridium lagenaria]